MKRKDLLGLLNIASVALASEGESVVKIYQNFCFTKKNILAYNDVVGIRLKNPGTVFYGVAPGRLLMKFIKSCTGEHIEFLDAGKEAKWRVQCGPTKLDFGYQPEEEFPFKFPDPGTDSLALDDSFFEGLDLVCSVVSEKGFSAWTSGVIFYFTDEGTLILGAASGNRNSIHIYEVGDEFGSRDQVILPIQFCRSLLDMRKSFKDENVSLFIEESYVIATFGDLGAIFGRTIVPEEKVALIEKAQELIEDFETFVPLSDKVREVLERADSVAGKDDHSILTITDDNKMIVQTKIAGGVVRDALTLKEEHPSVKVQMVPGMLTLKMDKCSELAIKQRLIAMRSDDGVFVKLVANRN